MSGNDDLKIDVIDHEHQVQTSLIKSLAAVVDKGDDPAELTAALTDYSRAHFLSEELLMRLHAYPDYEGHCQDHERLIEALEELATGAPDREALRSMIQGVAAAVTRHISTRDRRLSEYIVRMSAD